MLICPQSEPHLSYYLRATSYQHLIFHCNGITGRVALCSCLLAFSIISCESHTRRSTKQRAEQSAAVLTCHILFPHFSAQRHLSEHSHVGFAWTHKYVLNSLGPLEWEGHMISNFYSAKLVSTAKETSEVFTSSARAVLVSPHLHRHLLACTLWIIARLVKSCLIMF